MASTLWGCSTTSRVMSSGLQGVPSRPTCRSSNRRAFTWRSISRRRLHLAFLYRMCSLLGPTRCANEARGAAVAWPIKARAQQPTKTLKIGTVAGTPRSSPQWVAFERRMAELGYQEGRNFSFDFLQAASADEYEALYRKLAAREPDVILAIGPEVGLKSALAITRTVPIVMIAIDYDPLARGYVTSLARPSGNVTGVVFQQIELAAKRIQLIKDGFPDRLAATMFWD